MIRICRSQTRYSRAVLAILTVCSLALGIIAFLTSQYRPSTLVLEATSLEKGTGTVLVYAAGARNPVSRNFPITDDQGGKQLYVVELPAVKLEKILIAPLARQGNFAIERIILENDAISYLWDEQGVCTRKTLVHNVLRRDNCREPQPGIAAMEDGTVVIAALPETGTIRAGWLRAVGAIAVALSCFLGGLWLLRPLPDMPRPERIERLLVRGVWLLLFLLYGYQLFQICAYSVDVPYYDDWFYFLPDGISHDFPLRWLFGFFHEHRIVPTKFMAWLNLVLFNLDFRLQKILNYVLFAGLLGALVALKNRAIGKDAFRLFPLFMLFLLSPIIWENHRWAFQSQIHLALLCAILALNCIFNGELTHRKLFSFWLLSLCAMYSFSAGLILVAITLLSYSLYTGAANVYQRSAYGFTGGKMLLLCGTAVVSFLVWFQGYGHADQAWTHSGYLFPTEIEFWWYFLNLLSFSFGVDQISLVPGVIILGLLIVPVAILLIKSETRRLPSVWSIVTLITGILVVLAAISMARPNVNFTGVKTSRYVEIGFLLIPCLAMIWWLVLPPGRWRSLTLSLFWLVCGICYLDNWSPQIYRYTRQVDFNTLECVERYFDGRGDGVCQGLTSPQLLDRARALDVTFIRQFATERPGSLP